MDCLSKQQSEITIPVIIYLHDNYFTCLITHHELINVKACMIYKVY